MERLITFKKAGYDPSIDYLKGVCILLVVLTHCIPTGIQKTLLFPIWGLPAVPLFILIQVFHAYKRGTDVGVVKWGKLWERIIKPFLIVELLIGVILFVKIIIKDFYTYDELKACLYNYLINGGRGPGSYYPWIYMQFALLLPATGKVLKKFSLMQLAIGFAICSMVIELVVNLTGMSHYLYRVLFLRYVFIIFLGYLLVQKGFIMSKTTIILSIISIIATYFFAYSKMDLEPNFYTYRWKTCHWICYIYEFYLLLYLIILSYRKLNSKITSFFRDMGKYSYEIFLFQMIWFISSDYFVHTWHWVLYVAFSVVICIFPIVWYKRYCEKTLKQI